jgi:hypothetical protein
MQPPTDGPRAGFTTAQVQYLVENSSSFDVDMGMELLTGLDLTVDVDISEDVSAIQIQRNSLANLHASMTMSTVRLLNWGSSLVRPYITFTGQTAAGSALSTMRFYQGVYFTDTPETDLSEIPPKYDVTGYDVLSILDDAVGDAYSVDTGVSPLDTVEAILLNRGVTRYSIDPDARGSVLSSPLVWTMEDNITWLRVVNALLATVGYAGIWSDWNGVLQCKTYISPADRSPEWVMTSDVANTLLTQRRRIQHDYYDAPNRWVFYRTNNTEDAAPIDGAGRWEYINDFRGETSVEARGGRTITKVLGVEAVDQASLIRAGQSVIDADMSIPTTIPIETAPFPMAWHFDKINVSDPILGASLDVLATSWSLNLDGSDMGWEWTRID